MTITTGGTVRSNRFRIGPHVAQYLAAVIASLTALSAGLIFGWPSPSFPKLLKNSSSTVENTDEFRISADESSWVVSTTSFGAILGPLLMSLTVDYIGRKWSIHLLAVPILTSWLMIGVAEDIVTLYIGRFLGGVGVGATFALMPLYLGEIAEDRIRGALSCLFATFIQVGYLVAFSVGPWVTRKILSVVSAAPILLFLVTFHWIPETPYFYLIKGDREKAKTSLIWLRRKSNVEEELSKLQTIVFEEQKNRVGFGIVKLLSRPSNRKAFIISLGLMTIQQCSGLIAIQSYGSLIFEDSGLVDWTNYSLIIVGFVQVITSVGGIFVIDAFGRRSTLLCSLPGTALFLLFEAIFFHAKYLGCNITPISWLPLLGVIGFNVFCIPGIISVPEVMASELFPTDVKASATMILAIYGSLLGAAVAKIYQAANSAFGPHWSFYAFVFNLLAGTFFVYFYVPETKMRSLEEIQIYLKIDDFKNNKIIKSKQDAIAI